jgi:hypothetical protein
LKLGPPLGLAAFSVSLYGSMPVTSIGSTTAGVRLRVGETGAVAVAGSVPSLGGLNVDAALCPDEGDGGIDTGWMRACAVPIEDGACDWACDRSGAGRENFCRGTCGTVGRGLRPVSLILDSGAGEAGLTGFRLVDIVQGQLFL